MTLNLKIEFCPRKDFFRVFICLRDFVNSPPSEVLIIYFERLCCEWGFHFPPQFQNILFYFLIYVLEIASKAKGTIYIRVFMIHH